MPFPTRLGPFQIPTSTATFLTVAQPQRWTDLALSNVTAIPINVAVYIVPVGDIPRTQTQFFGLINIPPNDVLVYAFNLVVGLGDTVQASASAVGVNFWGTFSDEKN